MILNIEELKYFITLPKNNAMSTEETIFLEDDFMCCRIKNNSGNQEIVKKYVSKSAIQFHFISKGSGTFFFNEGVYTMNITEDAGLILYNPKKQLPIHVALDPQSYLLSIVISINSFHKLFSDEGDFIPFLAKENMDKKHYSQPETTPLIDVILSQIMNFKLHPSVQELYYRTKIYELLCFLFNPKSDADSGSCPIKGDSEEMKSIQQAKNFLIDNLCTPPTIKELADEIGLNTKKLKQGFKQVYGHTVYGFLLDYKMEYAQKLLDKGTYNVNEVSAKVGYSAASHFISAFKKKFGTTPKQYLISSKNIKNERSIIS